MKAVVVLADRSRHEVEIAPVDLRRGKFEFLLPEDLSRELATGAPLPWRQAISARRIGSDDGVPVFVER